VNQALSVVVLVSGRGSNLGALLALHARGALPLRIAAVISNRPGAAALERARAHGVATEVIDHTAFAERSHFDAALATAIDRYRPGLLVMAGFMRILTEAFIERYEGRMLNIHPSLLPDFRGLHTHARALEAGVERHGASVHFVTAQLDGGPTVLQATVAVRADDSVESLAERVRAREHRLLPLAVRWFAEGRLTCDGHSAALDGHALAHPLIDPPEIEHEAPPPQ
jgi:phosphoribosylglycinamide formyltransferase-1